MSSFFLIQKQIIGSPQRGVRHHKHNSDEKRDEDVKRGAGEKQQHDGEHRHDDEHDAVANESSKDM